MANPNVPPIPVNIPPVDQRGYFTEAWMTWFRQIFARVGGFNAPTNNDLLLDPMTTIGDMIYGGSGGAPTRLPGSTSATKKFLTQTGSGTVSAPPVFGTIAAADVPTLNQNTSGNAATATAPASGSANGVVTLDGSAHFQSVAPGSAGNYLRSDGTNFVASAIQQADIPVVNSSIKYEGGNGFGSTNTVIRKFSTQVFSNGSDITYTGSATNGDSFTINTTGIYAVTVGDASSAAAGFGISVNSNQLTTNISTITNTNRLGMAVMSGGNVVPTICVVRRFSAGDVIRHHGDGGANGADVKTSITICRIL